ncbi:MAG: PIN domain-containing protein [Candidatus Aenigmatarchaeota archaeon]
MGKIYLDTFVFMDILSGEDIFGKAIQYIEEAKKVGGVISAVQLTELGFHLRRRKSREKTEEILFYIQSLPNLEIIPVTGEIAKDAGLLRARYRRMKTQKKFTYFDCIHLATALAAKCTKFVTGDRGFKEVKEIETEIY